MLFLQAIFFSIFLNFMQIHPLLQPYHRQNRILITFSQDENNTTYSKQIGIFEKNQPDIIERDLVIFKIFKENGLNPDQKQLSQQEVESLRKHFKIKNDFQMLLIGKDGTVKERYHEAVQMETINSLIDAMPMRKQEMKKKP